MNYIEYVSGWVSCEDQDTVIEALEYIGASEQLSTFTDGSGTNFTVLIAMTREELEDGINDRIAFWENVT